MRRLPTPPPPAAPSIPAVQPTATIQPVVVPLIPPARNTDSAEHHTFPVHSPEQSAQRSVLNHPSATTPSREGAVDEMEECEDHQGEQQVTTPVTPKTPQASPIESNYSPYAVEHAYISL